MVDKKIPSYIPNTSSYSFPLEIASTTHKDISNSILLSTHGCSQNKTIGMGATQEKQI